MLLLRFHVGGRNASDPEAPAREDSCMFIDRSSLIVPNPPHLHYGMAVADVDGDGTYEAFVCGFAQQREDGGDVSLGGPNKVYKWEGTALVDIADPVLADMDRAAIAAAAADIDGDGREEIYVLNSDTFMGPKRFADRLFDYQGGEWIDLFELPENQAVLNQTAGRSVCAIDRLGNGRYGLVVANYGGPLRLYEFTPEGILVDVAPEANIAFTTGGRSLLCMPLVSQVHMDILAGNENSANFLFANQGNGTFLETARARGLDDPREHARGLAAVDGGHGRLDIALGNWEGRHRYFRHNEGNTFEDVAPREMARPSRVRTLLAGDFDNNGRHDLFFQNINEPNRLFIRSGNDEWHEADLGAAAEPHGHGTGGAVADFDRDGRLELLLAHGESAGQPLSYYHGPDVDRAWLRVEPRTIFGAPARGAIVWLHTDKSVQVRSIDAGSGYLCQMEPVAHFGLKKLEERIQRVVVQWPDGTTHQQTKVSPNQTLVVPHPRRHE